MVEELFSIHNRSECAIIGNMVVASSRAEYFFDSVGWNSFDSEFDQCFLANRVEKLFR